MEKLFATLRELADPATWSAGVELARNGDFHDMGRSPEGDRQLRVGQGVKDSLVSVSLSEDNEAWQSDCTCGEDPCRHVVAAVLALKQGRVGTAVRRTSGVAAHVVHALSRDGARLSFTRWFSSGDERREVMGGLAQALERPSPGAPMSMVTESERLIDHVLPNQKRGVFAPKDMRHLLPALSRVPVVELDGERISVSSEAISPALIVEDVPEGYRLRRELPEGTTEVFENGAALRLGILHPLEDSALTVEEVRMMSGAGTVYPRSEGVHIATRILPALAQKIRVTIESRTLPRARVIRPRLIVETIADDAGEQLTAIPHLVYGDPVIAEVRGGQLELISEREVPIRDVIEEARLVREVESRLMLRLGQARVLTGAAAVRFSGLLKSWETSGDGAARFTASGSLVARVVGDGSEVAIEFGHQDAMPVSLKDALAALKSGTPVVKLTRGDGSGSLGWGHLPVEWMERHRHVLERFLEAREQGGVRLETPAQLLSETDELCADLGVAPPPYFERLKRGLQEVDDIPDAELPRDLQASLRSYQQVGVNWLAFLREYGLCGLLADDMGLGKTLQALCVAQGRTLIVAPTSVIYSWREQIARFRPALTVALHHGARRDLGSAQGTDIVITSYALLRRDIEELAQTEWDTVILDEAQTIRNPDSQVAQAAQRLQGRYRIALSGTPVENSLRDLWSVFRFLQPGLLGSRSDFERRFLGPIEGGDRERTLELRRRVLPFILRRLKRDVATELPPKTEIVLECELTSDERLVYDALLNASRAELLQFEGESRSAISVLESLLRLRQACCHGALLPGISAARSSKVELLIESLLASREAGHRSLVFSQWTSLLDLIEPRLREEGVHFSRIDGSTKDREGIVSAFQAPDGPSVMLLSLKAGGLGITLTAADHVFIVDPWWNPAVEEQAADRAYRIGQENPVLVHRLVASDTVEERVLALQEQKRGLLRAAVGEQGGVSLSATELRELLGE